MNQTYIKYFFFASIFIALFSSCLVEPKYPIEPKIDYKSFEIIDNTKDSLAVSFTFRDGDGDIGLSQGGTPGKPGEEDPRYDALIIVPNPNTGQNDTVVNPLFFNVFIDLFYQNEEGGFDIVTLPDGLTLNGRIPRLTTEAKPRPIEGDITFYKEISEGFRSFLAGKLIKAKVSIRDRAQHVSNEIETDTIRVSVP